MRSRYKKINGDGATLEMFKQDTDDVEIVICNWDNYAKILITSSQIDQLIDDLKDLKK